VIVQFILVLQWPASSEADYEALIAMESQLESALANHGVVDGHDFGSGEMNIFVETDNPDGAFAEAGAALRDNPRWADLRAAYREATGESYEVLWPPTLRDLSVT
jgi:hypothetical protein